MCRQAGLDLSITWQPSKPPMPGAPLLPRDANWSALHPVLTFLREPWTRPQGRQGWSVRLASAIAALLGQLDKHMGHQG